MFSHYTDHRKVNNHIDFHMNFNVFSYDNPKGDIFKHLNITGGVYKYLGIKMI